MSFRRSALITLFAFVMNALVPFFAVYAVPAPDQSTEQLQSLFGDKLLICTADGFQWVSIEDLKNGTDHPKPHPDYKCALCYVAAHGVTHISPIGAATPMPAIYARQLVYAEFRAPSIDSCAVSIHRSRAPPVSFRA